MSCSRTMHRSVCLIRRWRSSYRARKPSPSCLSSMPLAKLSGSDDGGPIGVSLRQGCQIARLTGSSRRSFLLNHSCSYHDNNTNISLLDSSIDRNDDGDENVPQYEAVLETISGVAKTDSRVGQIRNANIGGTLMSDSTKSWLALDQQVNSYPTVRGFTAIGSGGDDFVQSMVLAVESVLQQPISEVHIKHKSSSGGKYVSVNIGPVPVSSSEQVQAVYNAMRRDERMKYFF